MNSFKALNPHTMIIYSLLSEFSNREKIGFVISFIAFLWFLKFVFKVPKSRKALSEFLKSAFKILVLEKLGLIYLGIGLYLIFLAIGLRKLNILFPSLFDEFVLFFFTAMFLLSKAVIKNTSNEVVNVILEIFKWSLILEIIVDDFKFPLYLDILFMLLLSFMALIELAFQSQNKVTPRALKIFQAIFGLGIAALALFDLIQRVRIGITFEEIFGMILPIILTILFLPYVYLVAYYSLFQHLNIVLNNRLKNPWYRTKVKICVALFLFLRLDLILRARRNVYRIE